MKGKQELCRVKQEILKRPQRRIVKSNSVIKTALKLEEAPKRMTRSQGRVTGTIAFNYHREGRRRSQSTSHLSRTHQESAQN
jgi:hypothetical protein